MLPRLIPSLRGAERHETRLLRLHASVDLERLLQLRRRVRAVGDVDPVERREKLLVLRAAVSVERVGDGRRRGDVRAEARAGRGYAAGRADDDAERTSLPDRPRRNRLRQRDALFVGLDVEVGPA